jgi:hypothetical protein
MGKTYEGKSNSKYNYVGLPKEMSTEIKRIIATDKRLGFVSMQEFVKESVRRSIVEYGGSLSKEIK